MTDVLPVLPVRACRKHVTEGLKAVEYCNDFRLSFIAEPVKSNGCEFCEGTFRPDLENQAGKLVMPGSICLRGCTGLKEIPPLEVAGSIDLTGCTGLKEIPPLMAGWNIYLTGCTGLKEIPLLEVAGNIYLDGCTGLKEIPLLEAGGSIYLPTHLKKNEAEVVR